MPSLSFDPKLANRYRAIVEETLRLETDEAKRTRELAVKSQPGKPATPDAIARAEKKRKQTFPTAYRTFLQTFDGWKHFSWQDQLHSTKELAGSAYDDATEVFEDCNPLPEELAEALVIGSSDGARRFLLLESGEVVEWLYDEKGRYEDFASFLERRKAILLGRASRANEAKAAIEKEWEPKARAKEDAELGKEISSELRSWKDVPPPKALRAEAKPPKAVKPSDLVCRRGKTIVAEVGLGLTLYLGAAPTKDEVIATYRAFRKRFPVKASMEWAPAEAVTFSMKKATSADGESFIDALAVTDEGHFGLRASLVPTAKKSSDSKNTYFINIRAVPAASRSEAEGTGEKDNATDASTVRRAAFVEVFVPAYEDPEALEALCKDLVELLPVRSGIGGFTAQIWDDEVTPDPWDTVFTWCRRFFALDPAYLDGWLVAARRRLRGASWLTVIGTPFADVLASRLKDLPSSITKTSGGRGLVLRAGAKPSLGDVARGEYPTEVALVAHAIEPLLLSRFSKGGFVSLGGGLYASTFAEELPGGFAGHKATLLYLHRFRDPELFARGPTVLEEAEALLEKLAAATKASKHLKEWQKKKRAGEATMSDLTYAIQMTAHPVVTAMPPPKAAELGIQALEVAARYPDDSNAWVYNSLLYSYLNRPERFAAGLALVPEVLRKAKSDPFLYHNVACIYSLTGRIDDALEVTKLAKEAGYDQFDSMENDDQLAAVAAARPKEWAVLFAKRAKASARKGKEKR